MSEEVGECLPEEVAICVNTKHMKREAAWQPGA